jgi:hypothetical protein
MENNTRINENHSANLATQINAFNDENINNLYRSYQALIKKTDDIQLKLDSSKLKLNQLLEKATLANKNFKKKNIIKSAFSKILNDLILEKDNIILEVDKLRQEKESCFQEFMSIDDQLENIKQSYTNTKLEAA